AESAIEDSAAPIHDRRGHVTGAVMVFHDVSAARAMSLRMSYLAQHDSLTDLPNRIMFSDRLNQAITLADREHNKLAVLYMDLDRFKHANDTLGHSIGDDLLKQVAQRLRNCVRGSDTVSRQGGDEFVVLLSQLTEVQDAELIATKILIALRAPYQIDVHELHLTVSIGIAIYPDDGRSADALLKHSDFAMYQAKDGGRDNCQFYNADLNVMAAKRHTIESSLRLALQKQEFVLFYQPIINLKSGAIKGVEALIRWKRGQELLSPAEFIPVAEETGLIVPIGRWVLREACRQARAWENTGLPPRRIAVNISAVELRAPDFVASVRNILHETGLRAENLELELTETFRPRDEKATASTLKALDDMGVRMALDDFGTGYSSLSYVRRMPISCLKVDQSFVRSLGRAEDRDDASIVSAVIHMGKSMNMNVVAEGVETRDQLAFLKAQSCPEGQGFHFSRPVAHDAMEKLLNDSAAALRRMSASQAMSRQAPYAASAFGE
ncbi:MAG: EAL domain-containing protein, partial [Pseudomonadota bacterium]